MAQGGSILAADFGSVYTRLLMIDVVDGVYRVLARTQVRSTGGFPAGNVKIGLRQAARRIEQMTGRRLLDGEGRVISPEGSNRTGVDIFVATASGGRSLRAVLVGLMPDVSIASALRATEGSYVDVVDVISLYDDRTEEYQLNAIIVSDPDLLFVTGGIDGGATEPVRKILRLVKLALSAQNREDRPLLLYAGNADLVDEVKAEFSELTRVLVAANVRPTLDIEDLDSARIQLGQAFDEYKEAQGSGFDEIGQMSALGLLPTAQSYSVLAQYLGKSRQTENRIVALDVGSAASTIATYEDDQLTSGIRTDLGLGHSAPSLVEAVDVERIRRWLPFAAARADIFNYALNKRVRPATIPMNRDELFYEHALLRAAIEVLVQSQHPNWRDHSPQINRIVAGGSTLNATGNPGLTAMLLLDAIQPGGLTDIYADVNNLVPVLGALAYIVPEAVVQLVDGNNLEHIGAVFSVEGTPNLRRAAIRYEIRFDDGEVLTETLNGGEILMVDLPPGKTARVKVNAARGSNLTIGGKRSFTQDVTGGLAGIIFDTRGRPLPLALDNQKRMLQLMLWSAMASGVEPEEYPEARLVPVPERDRPDEVHVTTPAKTTAAKNAEVEALLEEPEPKRRGLFGRGRKQEKKAEPQRRGQAASILDEDVDVDELEALFEDEDFKP